MFFQVVSGIDAVVFFSYTIFKDSGTDISPNLCSIAVGSVEVMSIILCSFVIDRFGRRPLLLFSEITIVISHAAMGLFFYLLKSEDSVKETLGWLPLTSLMLYAIGYSAGMGPIPWIFLEILPTRVAGNKNQFQLYDFIKNKKFKIFIFSTGRATGIAVCFNWAVAFVIIRFFETVNQGLGREWSFWIFCICSIIGSFFIYFCVPETKGKTLEEIHEGFRKR